MIPRPEVIGAGSVYSGEGGGVFRVCLGFAVGFSSLYGDQRLPRCLLLIP